MDQYYSKNGKEPVWAGANVGTMSPDGKYIYCTELRYTTISDDVKEYHPSLSVLINGTSHTIFKDEVGFHDSDGWWYWPRLIACSGDYKEILFSVYDDIYYYSVNDGSEAQHIDKIKDVHLWHLLSLNRVGSYVSIYPMDQYSDTISAWRNSGGNGGDSMPFRTQKSLQNSVFCLLKEQNGVNSGSIVRFVDNEFIELIPNITGNICLSADGAKLWCVADGRLAFCDLNAESPHAIYCDTAYVRAYGEDGEVGVSGDWTDQWALGSVPVAVTSDGETACFISVDGSLWMCTPDTIRNPQFVSDHAFWVQCSADNVFYIMSGDPNEYFQGQTCDLYLIGANGEMDYQYSNVIDMYMTKNDIYISVAKDDGTYLTDASGALYCISDGGYELICDDYSVDDICLYWWGA